MKNAHLKPNISLLYLTKYDSSSPRVIKLDSKNNNAWSTFRWQANLWDSLLQRGEIYLTHKRVNYVIENTKWRLKGRKTADPILHSGGVVVLYQVLYLCGNSVTDQVLLIPLIDTATNLSCCWISPHSPNPVNFCHKFHIEPCYPLWRENSSL